MYKLYCYIVPVLSIFIIFNGISEIELFFPTCVKELSHLGENSICIYSMHWFFLGISVGGVLTTIIVRVMTATMMPIFVGDLIKRNRVLNKVLLGGR